MDATTIAGIITLVITSGIGLEVVKHFFNKRSVEKKDDREEDAQNLDLALKIRTQVIAETKVLHEDMSGLRGEIRELKVDVKYWQDKHDKVLRENAKMQTQYILVASTLNNVILWLRQHDMEVPFQM